MASEKSKVNLQDETVSRLRAFGVTHASAIRRRPWYSSKGKTDSGISLNDIVRHLLEAVEREISRKARYHANRRAYPDLPNPEPAELLRWEGEGGNPAA